MSKPMKKSPGEVQLQTRISQDASKSGALLAVNQLVTIDGVKSVAEDQQHVPNVPLERFLRTEYLSNDSRSRKDRLDKLLCRPSYEPNFTQVSMQKLMPTRFPARLPAIDPLSVSTVSPSFVDNQSRVSSEKQLSISPRPFTPENLRTNQITSLNQSISRPHTADVDRKGPSDLLVRIFYDDTDPVNDDVIFHIKALRSRLLWPKDLPVFTIGSREKFLTLMVRECKLTGLMPVDMKFDRNLLLDSDSEDQTETGGYQKLAKKIAGGGFSRQDDGKFVYCLPRNRASPGAGYDPYDIQVVSAQTAKMYPQYWTVSASAVTRFWKVGPREDENFVVTPIIQWLWERELFVRIKGLRVFKFLRLWKRFTIWRMNVRHIISQSVSLYLGKRLYFANEVLQGCLLHVQGLCEAASSSKTGHGSHPDSAINLLHLDLSQPRTLTDFITKQRQYTLEGRSRLDQLRASILSLVFEACATVAEMEGIRSDIRSEATPRQVNLLAQSPAQLGSHVEESKDEELPCGTPHPTTAKSSLPRSKSSIRPPTYAEKTQWKKILKRLAEFIRLIDCQLLDLLHRLVITAAGDLDKAMNESWTVGRKLLKEAEEQRVNMQMRRDSDDSNVSDRMVFRSKVNASTAVKQTGAYVIPHFDFEKIPEAEQRIDTDELIRQIKKRAEVIQVPSALFSVKIVLNVPEKNVQLRQRTASTRKSVTFEKGKDILKEDDTSNDAKPADEDADNEEDSSENESQPSDGEEEEDDNSQEELMEESDEESDKEVGEQAAGTNLLPPKTAEDGGDGARTRRSSEKSRGSIKKAGCAYTTLESSAEEFTTEMTSLIHNLETTVGEMPSLLKEDELRVFDPSKYDHKPEAQLENPEDPNEELVKNMVWPDLTLIFDKDPHYRSTVSSILRRINNCFKKAARHVAQYNVVCKMVDRAITQDEKVTSGEQTWTTDDFHALLFQYSEQVRQIKHMTQSCRLNMLTVEASDFANSSLPYPRKILDAVNQRLPSVANTKNEDLLQIIRGSTKRLDFTPDTVEDFVDHLSFLNKMSSELPAVDKEFGVINRLFSIARDFDVPLEAESLALYKILGPGYIHLKNTITYHEAKKEENLTKFSTDLDQLITKIRSQLIKIKIDVRDPLFLSVESNSSQILEKILFMQNEVSVLSQRIRSYANYQERFGSSLQASSRARIEEQTRSNDTISAQTLMVELSELERDLTLRRLLWESQAEWIKLYDDWTLGPFDDINVEQLQKNVNKFTQTTYMLEKGLPSNEVLPLLKSKVVEFKTGMPVIVAMRNPALQTRHWEQIEALIQRTLTRDASTTLGHLLELNIFRYKDRIQDISATASNEATLETMLNKVRDQWFVTDFRLVTHAGRETFIIAGSEDLLTQLEESQIIVGMIKGSRYVTPIKAQVEEWERRLALFSRTLEEWMSCQRMWLYLEQIFTTPDIQRQLTTESKMFTEVNRCWQLLMRNVEDRPNAIKSATAQGVLQTLQNNNLSLERIQKSLEDYLETKRLIFPRFYFLSNDELLDIMAKSKSPDAVQPHLDKLFGNIRCLEIQQLPRQPPTVISMISAEGEVVPMPKNVRARGPIEQWLGSVEQGMNDTVKRHLKLGLSDYQTAKLEVWVTKHPGQVILTGTQIGFNQGVMGCLKSDNSTSELSSMAEGMVVTLNHLASLVSHSLVSFKRLAVEAMLIVNVHSRDIVTSLIENNVCSTDDFQWTRQLRYEWDESTNNCNVLQSASSFVYGYEYLGCSPRLVLTPLTDRCYLTLTGALHLNLGGSPAGPAGTGKTETVKDLAKSVGKQCVVFNCSEGLDYKMMGKLFAGLVQSGSWCCFDEFNRIDVEVLSVIASQIHSIKTAKDGRVPRFTFENRDIKLNMTCGIFITMNPSYAGRVELPDNLKSLFRPVAMMVPDYALIAEILLFSEGFVSAKILSRKIVNLYQLASKQLSQQDHYDFGMRAIKSVLIMAGHMRVTAHKCTDGMSEFEESQLLIQALRDSNLPRFVAEDVSIFDSIMGDLFPGMDIPDRDSPLMEKAIAISIAEQNLQTWPGQVEKVHQLHTQLMVRHGVMLVGPTGGGKTTVRNILQKSLILLPTINLDDPDMNEDHLQKKSLTLSRRNKAHVDTTVINPKCVSMGELYGETDPNTLEWTDGLVAMTTRKFAKLSVSSAPTTASTRRESLVHTPTETTSTSQLKSESDAKLSDAHNEQKHWQWIVLDGPVDTIWVENLNTVLDDTKLLCLASGERIGLTSTMRYIFEVDDLSHASPATVSRCAMVYMDPVDLGWQPFVGSWLATRLPSNLPEAGRQHLSLLLNHVIDRGLNFARLYRKHQPVPGPDMVLVRGLLAILSAYLNFMVQHGGFGQQEDVEQGTAPAPPKSQNRRRSTMVSGTLMDDSSEGASTTALLPGQPMLRPDGRPYHLQKNPKDLVPFIGRLFVFAFTWSFGACFNRVDDPDQDRISGSSKDRPIDVAEEFDLLVHELFDVEPPLGVRLPSSSRSIYGYFLDLESGGFLPWDILVPTTQSLIERGAVITVGEAMGVQGSSSGSGSGRHRLLNNELIATADTVRYAFILALYLLNGSPVLVTGEPGVGKSVIVKDILKRLQETDGTSYKNTSILGSVLNYSDRNQALLDSIQKITRGEDAFEEDEKLRLRRLRFTLPEETRATKVVSVVASSLEFSAQTSARRVQQQITGKMVKRGRDSLGAPRGKKLIIFIDDINMPSPDEFGTQAPIEFLREMLDLNGFYDPAKLQWRSVIDTTLIGACAPVGGGRNQISPRFIKHFCVLTLPQPSTQSLQHIFQVQLGRFFQEGDFTQEVKGYQVALVSAGIAIYYKMRASMKPTPARIHYTFNLRDLSKVIHGLFQAHEKVVASRDQCANLLGHEATRVFHDRLCTPEDRSIFYTIMADELHNQFKVRWTAQQLQKEAIVFGDFFDAPSGSTERIYRPISDRMQLANIMEDMYMKQNVDQKSTNQYVFFKEAVDHIIRTVRILGQPSGHMLLVGLDGTGKTTTVHLSCFIAKADLYRLNLSPGYNITDFRSDLKKVYEMAGLAGKNVVLLLTDSDLVKESFLEDINCVLNSGDVPDLFDTEEMDNILMNLKKEAGAAGVADTRQDMYNFFIQRVSQHLHVVLTLSPTGANFRQRCRANPALVNCCTIDWFDEWDQEAMLSVAKVYFRDEKFLVEDQDLSDRVGSVCVKIYKTAKEMAVQFWEEMRRSYYLTPSSFIEFIKTFSNMLQANRGGILRNKDRLNNGLRQLSEANALVGTMQEELVALGPQIEAKAKETDDLLARLEKDRAAVEEIRQMVLAQEAIMQRETGVVEDYATQCEQDLESVTPIIEQAILALDSLTKTAISEVRVYLNPPELVKIVMAAVCILLKEKPDWATAKLLLGDSQFLKRLVNYDKSILSDRLFHRVKQYTKHPSFNPDAMATISLACQSICQWVLALEHYHDVHKMVKPKQKRVLEAREALTMAHESLAKKQERLSTIQSHLESLQTRYQNSVDEREALKERKDLTALRLQRAALLISALQNEKSRWEESIEQLNIALQGILGDTIISAGCVAYYGTLTSHYRTLLLNSWLDLTSQHRIPISDEFDFVNSQFQANILLDWYNQGLPRDPNSTENAVILKKSHRWSLLIDPQYQGLKFLQGLESDRLKLLSVDDPTYIQSLERCIRVGDPVVLVNIRENLDPTLGPVLRQEVYQSGGNMVIKIGDNEIEYNKNFRLYLTTSLSNPHYLPSVNILVTIINFTVNFSGLQDQLLSSVVSQEKPDLETSRAKLLTSLAADMSLLRELEDRTLGLLQDSTGHILDDAALPDTMEKSKAMVIEIGARVKETEDTERQLSTARKVYLPVATRGATLYFVLADLSSINMMYQFSLTWFQELFENAVAGCPEGDNLSLRMEEMIESLTLKTYQVSSAALFSHHQLVFSFLLCTSIMRSRTFVPTESEAVEIVNSKEGLDRTHWSLFMHGPVLASLMLELDRESIIGPSENFQRTYPGWVNPECWNQCVQAELCLPQAFEGLCRSLLDYKDVPTNQWEIMNHSEDPYTLLSQTSATSETSECSVFPWERLSSFERLILVKILTPSNLQGSIRQLIIDQIGQEFLYSGQTSLLEIFGQSEAVRPIIFILASGSDPLHSLIRLAKEVRGSTLHLDMVSLGRGQGIKAEELINKAPILKGRWIFLQNCHLAASWMPKLQQLVENFTNTTKMDDQFRLFLSAKPDSCFPISVLQAGIKMAVESPHGIKNILLRSFATDGTGMFSPVEYNQSDGEKKALIFSLCLFNAVILERKKYGPLGFNLIYEFNDSDLEVALLQQQQQRSMTSEVTWTAIHHLIGDITYGGRVTDEWDRRCLKSMLTKYLNDEVLLPGHNFTEDASITTRPVDETFEQVCVYLDTLPECDSASAFGMGFNAQQASTAVQARTLLDIVGSVQPRMTSADLTGTGGSKSSSKPRSGDELVLDMVREMMSKLPRKVEELSEEDPDTRKRLGVKPNLARCMQLETKRVDDAIQKQEIDREAGIELGSIHEPTTNFFRSALHNVLRQEIDRYDHLLQLINRSLKSLSAGIAGDEVMTQNMDSDYSALLMNRVPERWAKYASCKTLTDWTLDLIERAHFLAIWAERLVRKHQDFFSDVENHLRVGKLPPSANPQVFNKELTPTDDKEEQASSPPPDTSQQLPSWAFDSDQGQQGPEFLQNMVIMTQVEPTAYWLPGFFFPQGFITGVLQNQARKMNTSVDSLKLNFTVHNQYFNNQSELLDIATPFPVRKMSFQSVNLPSSDGVLIYGLYVDNACWDLDSKCLVESPTGRRFCKLPELHFQAVPLEHQSQPSEVTNEKGPGGQQMYCCPLYRTSNRVGALSSTGHSTNFVTSIDLPSDKVDDFWILRGTALLTQPELE